MSKTMKELVERLNALSEAYYNDGESTVSDYEYDALRDELERMEKETGIILPNSPSITVGARNNEKLKKVKHEYPALSLDKTKDIDLLIKKMAQGEVESGRAECVIMWKEDGATVNAVYSEGNLVQLSTRGDGLEGSVITHNAPYIKGVPLKIDYKGKLVVRGEAVMSFAEFNRINESLPAEKEHYKNARNLCSASIQDDEACNDIKDREIWFQAFNLVYKEDMPDLFEDRLLWLKSQGFNVVPYEVTNTGAGLLKEKMRRWEENVPFYEFPIDGLVICLNNAKYTDKLPGTSHNPHIYSGYAYKFTDEVATTTLRSISFSASRTGLLNPVAIFDPVSLEGTTVHRASLHNISYILTHDLKINSKIDIIKSNKIIPMLVKNHDKELEWNGEMVDEERKKRNALISECPICHSEVQYKFTDEKKKRPTLVAFCENPDCVAKKIGAFAKFASRDGMNIFGMSEETITKFIIKGWLKEFSDFWHLDRYKEEIVNTEGFGETSYNNYVAAAENARNVDFIHFVNALGIPNVGKGQAKVLKKFIESKKEEGQSSVTILIQDDLDLQECEGIGAVIAKSISEWCKTSATEEWFLNLLLELNITDDLDIEEAGETSLPLEGKVFVITGALNGYANRDELKEKIEALGGKVSGSVSKKTSYLINNDVTSTSGKNKKAAEIGIPVISEAMFETLL